MRHNPGKGVLEALSKPNIIPAHGRSRSDWGSVAPSAMAFSWIIVMPPAARRHPSNVRGHGRYELAPMSAGHGCPHSCVEQAP
jgi:hypothetical protein